MNTNNKPSGIILAAGFSSRMKDFKPLMPIGDSNALMLIIKSFQNAGISDLHVVVGFNADAMELYLKDKGVNIVRNENFPDGMFTSVRAGLEACGQNENGYLLTLVDCPLIPPYVIKNTVAHSRKTPDRFVVPCYHGKKGHPLYIPAKFRDEILAHDGEGGLKTVTDRHFDEFERIEMNCEAVVLDMDTPKSYEALLKYYEENKYPTREKCYRLLEQNKTPAHVIRHMETVTNTAVRAAYALNEKGYSLNIDLIRAAGLLHDVFRVKQRHWLYGAVLCRDYGYDEVADIVKVHMRYVHSKISNDFNETDIICLADRLCIEDRYASLEERMAPALKRHADDPEAIEAIERRMGATAFVKHEIERIIGRTIEALLSEPDPDASVSSEVRPVRHLYLVRHGETQKHKEPIFMGQVDIPLNAEGREQCSRAGLKLQRQSPNSSVIYCSDLKRARDSAKIISSILDNRPEIVEIPEFREISLGEWDGMFISEVIAKYPEEYKKRGQDLLTFKIGNDSENYYDLQYRVMKKYYEIINSTTEDVVIVAHAGVNKVILCNLLGKDLKELKSIKFERGDVVCLDI